MAKDQGKPVALIFNTAKDKYHAFNVVGWKVRSDSVVSTTDGKAVCDCQLFKFEGKCPHVTAIKSFPSEFVRQSEDWRNSERKLEWDTDPFKYILIADQTRPLPGVIHPEVGDLSGYDLVFAMTAPVKELPEDIQKKLEDKNSWLTGRRVYEELKYASKTGDSLISSTVIGAGAKVERAKESDFKLEGEYSDDSTAMPEESGVATVTKPKEGAIDWTSAKRPNPGHFYVREDDWKQLTYTLANGGNILLVGPSGCGKSELAYWAAKSLSLPIAAFNFGAMQEPRTTLIGATHFSKDKGTWFAESRFVRAVKNHRQAILLDELSRDRGASAHNILLPLLDRQGYLALDESEDSPVIHKGENVCFIATANIGMEYTGTEALDKALRDRMDVIIDLGFPPKEYEVKILLNRCKCRAGDASKLVDVATHQRTLAESGDFAERISTRMLISAGTRIAAGMSFEDAVKYSIVNHFSFEGGDTSERSKIKQVIQKSMKL